MFRKFILTAIAFIAASATYAQFQGKVFVEDSTIKVFANGIQKSLAWCGGFNNPQFAMGDLNNDGLTDLVVYEAWMNKVRAFINNGTATNPNYIYMPKYADAFSGIVNDYLKLEDYNRDGVADLITKGLGGFNVYKGKMVGNVLNFTYYKELRYNSPDGTINCYSQGMDIPGVADVDNDGDLDFFGYEDGSIIYFFKNCQVEHRLPKDTIEICKPTNCWGSMSQAFMRTSYLGIGNDTNACPRLYNYGCKATLHVGNNMLLLDMDGDGDYDLLNGNVSFTDLQFLKNGKVEYHSSVDTIVDQDTLWQAGGHQLEMPAKPAAFHLDIDGDGRKDILVSPHAYNTSENYKCIAFYKNMGTATVPRFVYQHDTLLVEKTMDYGSNAYPFIYDYNKDGRPDLFVGSAGFYQADGTLRSRIAYYQNTLVGGVARLELQTPDFKNIFAEQVEGAAPAFGDLDNDGKDDMIVGHTDGTLSFYKNIAASTAVQPVFDTAIVLKDAGGALIIPTGSVVPFIYDIDKDGRPDLLITGEKSVVYFYKNNGTGAGDLRLSFISGDLGKMQAGINTYSYGTIYIGKMDNTGKDYIVLGNNEGTIRRYTGFQNGNTTIPYQLIDDHYSDIEIKERSSVAFADLNLDGNYELITGNSLGGLQQFKQVLQVNANVGVGTVHNTGVCGIYPNPASSSLYINWDNAFAGRSEVNIRLVNMTGQVVAKTTVDASKGLAILDVTALPAGMYVCTSQAGANIYSQPVLIRK